MHIATNKAGSVHVVSGAPYKVYGLLYFVKCKNDTWGLYIPWREGGGYSLLVTPKFPTVHFKFGIVRAKITAWLPSFKFIATSHSHTLSYNGVPFHEDSKHQIYLDMHNKLHRYSIVMNDDSLVVDLLGVPYA